MIWSIIRWFLIMFLYGSLSYGIHIPFLFLGFIWFGAWWWWIILVVGVLPTVWIVFPIAYVFRKHLPNTFIVFDKEHGIYGDPKWRNAPGKEWRLKDNFKTAAAWLIRRNPYWNIWLIFKATRYNPKLIRFKSEAEIYNDYRDDLFMPCQIKTENDNYGTHFNPFKSKLGWIFIVYKDEGKVYWNWSKAFKKKDGVYIEWELGYNDKRPLLNRIRKELIG